MVPRTEISPAGGTRSRFVWNGIHSRGERQDSGAGQACRFREGLERKGHQMKKVIFGVSIVATVVVLLFVALLVVRYVDIPGTKWDNSLDLRPLIKWQLQVRAQ